MKFNRDIIDEINKEKNVIKVQESLRKNVLHGDEKLGLNIKGTSLYARKFLDKEFHDVYFNNFVSSTLVEVSTKSLLTKDPIKPIHAIIGYESMRRKSEDLDKTKLYSLFTIHHNLSNNKWTDILIKRGIEDLLIRNIYRDKNQWNFFNEKDNTTCLSFEYKGRNLYAEDRFGPTVFKNLNTPVKDSDGFNFFEFLKVNVSLFKEDTMRTTIKALDLLHEDNVLLGTASMLSNRLKDIESL